MHNNQFWLMEERNENENENGMKWNSNTHTRGREKKERERDLLKLNRRWLKPKSAEE